MTPPNWRRKAKSTGPSGTDPKRLVVLQTVGGVTEVAYCPPGVAISHYDYDDAEAEGRLESEQRRCTEDVARARQHAASIVDEQAAIDLLSEFWERAEAEDDRGLMDRIDEVLDPVTSFEIGGEEVPFAVYRNRREEGEG